MNWKFISFPLLAGFILCILMGCTGSSGNGPLEPRKSSVETGADSKDSWIKSTRSALEESEPQYYREEIAGGPIGMIEIPKKIRKLFDEDPGQTMTSLVQIVESSDFELVEKAVLQFRGLITEGMYIPVGVDEEKLDTINPRTQMTFREQIVSDMKGQAERELGRKR